MSPIEIKKIQVELLRVGAAKAEFELRIEEAQEQIERLKQQIQIQTDKEKELHEKLKGK